MDGAILETGQNVQLDVEEELRQELEPAQTLLLQTEELTVKETVLKQENVTRTNAKVYSYWLLTSTSANAVSFFYL